ncbi:MAG: hypothetical protein HQL05_08235, partial [Nitrospirae bacterium]|nr:hypothetical protein [Nitrospirota bacterium]
MARIDAFFKLMKEQGASDLHMVAGSQPILRIRGECGHMWRILSSFSNTM